MLKRYLSILLSLVISIGCFSYIFYADVSTGDRAVDLKSYQSDGSFKSENNVESNIYSLNLIQSTTATNKIRLTYTVDPSVTSDDLPQTIEVKIPSASVANSSKIETNYIDAVGSEIAIAPTADTTTIRVPIQRENLINKDSLVLTIPFTLTKLAVSDSVDVSLISAEGRSIKYSWNLNLVPASKDELTLPQRLNANTSFTKTSMKAATGFKYVLPLSVQSIDDEKTITVKISNPDFTFKNSEGIWTEGEGTYVMKDLTAGVPLLQQIEVFCTKDPMHPFTVSVDNEKLSTELAVQKDNISLTYEGTDTSLQAGASGKLKLKLAYTEELAGNNTFNFNLLNYDSESYSVSKEQAQVSVDDKNHNVTFSADYQPKKEYADKRLRVSVETTLEKNTYTVAEVEVPLSAVSKDAEIKDFSVEAVLLQNNEIKLVVENKGAEDEEIPVTVESDTEFITLQTDEELRKTSNTQYSFTAKFDGKKRIEKSIRYIVDDKCNTTEDAVQHSITFTLPADEHTANNTSVVKISVPGKKPTSNIDFGVVGFENIQNMYNGQKKETYLELINNSKSTENIPVSVKVSNENVVLRSSVSGWMKSNATEYVFTIAADAGKTIRIPFAIEVTPNCNTTKDVLPVSITAAITSADADASNNSKILPILVLPDKEVSDGLDLKDYFDLSFDSTSVTRMEPVVVTLTAKQLKPLQAELNNGVITLEVIGDVKEQTGSGNYSTTKNVATIDVSSLSSSIKFTPTNTGKYYVLAKVVCDGIGETGSLTKTHTFTIDATSGAYPKEPIVDSNAITMSSKLSEIKENKGTLSVQVTNNTDYILRDSYLTAQYSDALNFKYNGNIVRGDIFVDKMPPKTSKTFTFDVEVLKDGMSEITVLYRSSDLNTNIFHPYTSNNTRLYFEETQVKPTTYAVSGFVFHDKDNNGVMGVAESGLANVTVNLCEKVGNILKTTRTFASGYYNFTDVKPGTYLLKINYMGATSTKEITITSTEISNNNLPLYFETKAPDSGSGNLDNPGGQFHPGVPKANVSVESQIAETKEDSCIVLVTVKNQSPTATLARVSVSPNGLRVHMDDQWKAENGIYTADYFMLTGYDTKTFRLTVSRNKDTTALYITVNAITDVSTSDNSAYVSIPGLNRSTDRTDTDVRNNTRETRDVRNKRNVSDTSNGLVDFASTAVSTVPQNQNINVGNKASGSVEAATQQVSAATVPNTQQVYALPKTGDFYTSLSITNQMNTLLFSLMKIMGGVFLIYVLVRAINKLYSR